MLINTVNMKLKVYLALILLIQYNHLGAQKCEIFADSLKGTYEGDCKGGKANGKGVAKGINIYTGEFKAGMPDGKGTYTWPNGNSFEGTFKKGLKEGEGTLYQPKQTNADSVIKGWWKKDIYIGKYEKPYKVLSQSPHIMDVGVSFLDGGPGEITINTSSTSGGSATGDFGGGIKIRSNWGVTGIDLMSGNYKFKNYSQSPGAATDILFDVEYPLKVRLKFGAEFVEIELYEKKEWKIRISIHE